MANQTKAYCSRWFTAVCLCFLAHVWVAAALHESYDTECLNGGTPLPGGGCSCRKRFDGPMCELRSIGFDGTGFAVYPPIAQSNITLISLEVAPENDTGLVLYVGPYEIDRRYPLQDFLALELHGGLPVLVVDYDTDNTFVLDSRNCSAGVPEPGDAFTVELVLEQHAIEMIVDSTCRLVTSVAPLHRVRFDNPGFLNREDPLLLGGTAVDGLLLAYAHDWVFEPLTQGFSGCLSNVTINGRLLDLAMPNEARLVRPGCRRPRRAMIDHSFLYWILLLIVGIGFMQLTLIVSNALEPYEPVDGVDGEEIGHDHGLQVILMPEIGGGEGDHRGEGDGGVGGEPDAGELRQPTEDEEPEATTEL